MNVLTKKHKLQLHNYHKYINTTQIPKDEAKKKKK
jgi:hypothetical protein